MLHSVQSFLSCVKIRGMTLYGALFIFLFFFHTASNAQIQTGSFQFEGKTRGYIVFLPQNFESNMPVVLSLPGYYETAQWYMDYTMMNNVADTAGFIPVYPEAIYPGFNSGIGENPSWPTPNVNDVGFIDALIDTLYNYYSIDLQRIYVCGFSNGGFMANKLACELSGRIAAIASVAGIISYGMANNCNIQRTMPVLHIHGTADDTVPFNGATGWFSVDQTLDYWTSVNNCVKIDTVQLPDLDPSDGCTVKKISYTNCSNGSKVIFYKVINGGHSWPSAAADYSWAGNRTKDINAVEEIWNFFKSYELVTSIKTRLDSNPSEFSLFTNYPNPFNPTTTIQYELPNQSHIRLAIYNVLGREVKTLLNRNSPPGTFEIAWDGTDDLQMPVAGGLYFCRMESEDFVTVIKLALVR
jgi:polyhydroxybutyrate depolymerase